VVEFIGKPGRENQEFGKTVSNLSGKMVKFVSGRWRFVQLDAVDRFEKMSDLRVDDPNQAAQA